MKRAIAWLAAAILIAVVAPTPAAAAAEPTSAPEVTPASVHTQPVHEPVTFSLTPGVGAVPVRYQYRVDSGRIKSVRATAGIAEVAVTPAKRMTFVEFSAVAADGTASPWSWVPIYAVSPVLQAEQDHNGDAVADLLTVGGTVGLTPGLWLATGQPNSRVRTPATNIGAGGNGGSSEPSSFDGAQPISGHFTSSGFQDVLAYYPTGPDPASAVILLGSGDGSILPARYSGNSYLLSSGTFTDINGDDPVQLVNAYQVAENISAYDDLMAVIGSPANGYYLAYYPNLDAPGGYMNAIHLDEQTPTGGTDWQNWTLATTRLASGTSIYLWNRGTGGLYLWTGLSMTDNGDLTGSLAHTQYQISSSWNAGTALSTLQATDLNQDNIPDLWTVTPDGRATAYIVTALSTTRPAKIRAKPAQQLG
jgi:hypothetical protein